VAVAVGSGRGNGHSKWQCQCLGFLTWRVEVAQEQDLVHCHLQEVTVRRNCLCQTQHSIARHRHGRDPEQGAFVCLCGT